MESGLWAWFASPWALGLLGLVIGSFLNVVAHRLPRMMARGDWTEVAGYLGDGDGWRQTFGTDAPKEAGALAQRIESQLGTLPRFNLATPGSACPHCGRAIAWHENVPLLGWLRLKGRCAGCAAPISIRYPLVELLTGVLFALAGWRFGATPTALLWCGVLATLVTLSAIDWDTTLLPDVLNQPLLWAGLIAAALGWSSVSLPSALWGAVAGYLALWSVYWLFKLVTGKEGMGAGDFKLLAALGAWLGWPALLPIILASSIVGTIVGLGLKFSGGLRAGGYVPFGPFLAGGGIAVMLIGTGRVNAWLGL